LTYLHLQEKVACRRPGKPSLWKPVLPEAGAVSGCIWLLTLTPTNKKLQKNISIIHDELQNIHELNTLQIIL